MTQKRQKNTKKYLLLLAGLVIVALAVWGVQAYTHRSKQKDTANHIPGIDYSPATPTDNAANDQAKESSNYGTNPQPPVTTDKNIDITLAAAGQDQDGGPIEVKALLEHITEGVCKLMLKQGTAVVEKTTNIIRQNTYYTCDGFNIPFSDVQVGNAQLTLTVTATNGATNYASQDITIR